MANVLCVVVVLLFAASAVMAAPLEGGVSADRVQQIAAALPESTFSFGPRIDDRAAWDAIAKHQAFEKVIPDAQKKLDQPLPAMTAELYALYKKTGERTKQYGDVRSNRHGRIALYTMAECLENKGRFLKPLEAVIADICTEPTWIFNFHDTSTLDDWNGKRTSVDLGAVGPSQDMACAMVLLGDRLSPATRKLIESNCRRRILDPYRKAVEGGGVSGFWWITNDANWNAVCHAGVVGVAMGVLPDKMERAYFVAAAEKFSGDYLRGFGPDGYCNEGMGYWSYGFSNFMLMAELISQATDGKVDLFDLPNARAAALFPSHLEIQNGLCPSYADCGLNPVPDLKLHTFVNRHYRLGLSQWQMADTTVRASLPTMLMYAFPNSATKTPPADAAAGYELRSYFEHGGVLTCRAAKDSSCVMGVSLKGGHNAEAHNHNDVGTFVVAVGKQLLILDPGSEVYNARTFSKDRYKSNLLNSFGHPVPVVAGKLQREGAAARARILKADFTDAADTYAMDISSCYAVPELKQLVRTFTYDRHEKGMLKVNDEFAFASPQAFGGALLTYGQWKKVSNNGILISKEGEQCLVTIDSGGVPFEITSNVIDEKTHSGAKPTRIGINLSQPVESGRLVLTITPATAMP
jgi:hypothetical protein